MVFQLTNNHGWWLKYVYIYICTYIYHHIYAYMTYFFHSGPLLRFAAALHDAEFDTYFGFTLRSLRQCSILYSVTDIDVHLAISVSGGISVSITIN